MVFTFLKAKGLSVGTSLVEDDYVDTAKEVMEKAASLGKEILLPSDIVVADKFDAEAKTQVVSADAIPDGWMGLDNGPASTATQKDFLYDCKTVVMNGPLGVFEFKGEYCCDVIPRRAMLPLTFLLSYISLRKRYDGHH